MDNSNDEFEPLFDYTRVQPAPVICLGDDLDGTPDFASKKRRISDTTDEKKQDVNSKDVKVIDCDGKEEEEEEDWLPPPPKNLDTNSKSIGEDSTLKALSCYSATTVTTLHLLLLLQLQQLPYSFCYSCNNCPTAATLLQLILLSCICYSCNYYPAATLLQLTLTTMHLLLYCSCYYCSASATTAATTAL
ncbi:uncharacterized protein LOC121767191 [Salvia splendens]|uniref:uncharacterized protein LOC121767191 n=1 Tax=Salvia splendens TaxID=180675 RepID=UPI001C2770AC|nr:uncharacterized protein LOC121767191 [Salvia splendens]